MTAEAALRTIGAATRTFLIEAANFREARMRPESESSLRKRRSALALLLDIGLPRKEWPRLRELTQDHDNQIAFLACRICVRVGGKAEKSHAISRLASLRGSAHWLERVEIDRYLQDFADKRRRKKKQLKP